MIRGITVAFIAWNILGAGGEAVNFDRDKPGSLPPYWTSDASRRWEVRADPGAPSRPNLLTHRAGNAADAEFAQAVFDKVICLDGDLSVKFRISPDGPGAKTVGLLWRYQDPRNYYVLRFSVDNKNIALFRVLNGQMRPVPPEGAKDGGPGVRHELRTGQWYVARVIFRGSHFSVHFGNRKLFDATDTGLAAPGRTGVRTPDGTSASFDDFHIERKG